MSKCVECGNELLTGDIHWEMGLCNQCWNVYRHVDILNKETYALLIGNLKQQLAEKDKEINNLKELRKLEVEDKKELRENRLQEVIKLEKALAEKDKTIKEINKAYIETYKREREKDKEIANIRHQVCEEIRKKAFATEAFCDDKSEIVTYTIDADTLDQIEGENDDN